MVERQVASTGEFVEVPDRGDEASSGKKGPTPTMEVKVYAPFKVYYEGLAYSITAVNETGPFDILPHHHKFLCMLVPCDLVIVTPSITQNVRISRALMHVTGEKVTIYVDV